MIEGSYMTWLRRAVRNGEPFDAMTHEAKALLKEIDALAPESRAFREVPEGHTPTCSIGIVVTETCGCDCGAAYTKEVKHD